MRRSAFQSRPPLISPAAIKLWRRLAIASNWPVLAAVLVLSATGLMTIYFQNPALGLTELRYLCVALGCMAVVQLVPYTAIGRYAWGFYIFSLLLVLYTVIGAHVSVPGVENVKGAYAWIHFGSLSLEPSELMKIAFILVLARYLRFRSTFRTFPGLLPPLLLALFPMTLILMQPDLGVAALFAPTLLAMLFVAGARAKHLLIIFAIALMMVPVFWFGLMRPYQRDRVLSMISSDPQARRTTGYQTEQTQTAMGFGGIAGRGAGNLTVSRHVPEAYNDMIFAVIGEQFGFIGSVLVLIAYGVLFAAGIEISAGTREPFAKLVALGIVVLLASQTTLNLMVVMGLFPVTGVTLPFVSDGGSSLVASFVEVGLLLNIGQNRPLVIARPAFEFD